MLVNYLIYFLSPLLRMINTIVHKPRKSVMFFPHTNCRNDNYDVFNYGADNVLCVLNYLLNNSYQDYNFTIVYYEKNKLHKYKEYCYVRGYKNVRFVCYESQLDFFNAVIRNRIILTDNIYQPIHYKIKSQKIICLGYYVAPFKEDFHRNAILGVKGLIKKYKMLNRSFDNYVTTSDICSRLISLDTLVYYPKFKTLGFPRNDIFYRPNIDIRKKILDAIKKAPKYIICYTPTHRDFENSNRKQYKKDVDLKIHERTIWGNEKQEDESKLYSLLEKLNAVIVAKIHPVQETSILKIDRVCDRIFLYSEIEKKCDTNLQELLAISDILITDYSTTCFDYLHTKKPTIFYMYDDDDIYKYRGLFIKPISPICPGEIVYNFEDLCEAIDKTLSGEDNFKDKRFFIHDLLNTHHDGNSTQRVVDVFIDNHDN